THNRSIALIKVAPVHVIRQFHAAELCADLPSRKFLEFLFGGGIRSEDCHGKKCELRGLELCLHPRPDPRPTTRRQRVFEGPLPTAHSRFGFGARRFFPISKPHSSLRRALFPFRGKARRYGSAICRCSCGPWM